MIFKALAKDPGQRYQSMQEFADDLQRFRAAGPAPTRRWRRRLRRWSPGRRAGARVELHPRRTLPQAPCPRRRAPAASGVSRTVESEPNRPPKKRFIALVVAVLALVFIAGGAVVAGPQRLLDPAPPRDPDVPRPRRLRLRRLRPHGQPAARRVGRPQQCALHAHARSRQTRLRCRPCPPRRCG